jgi:hypothetical protein
MDLDRTLFDTELFFNTVWSYVGGYYGLDDANEKSKAKEYFDAYGDSYDYRFFDHLRESIGADFDQEEFVRGAKQELSGTFLYSDVTPEVLEMTHAILTFGNREYQTFKLSLCPELADVERHIVLETKGEYISRTFKTPTVLVDDKDLSAEIVPPARFIRIDRSSGGAKVEGADVIHTLKSLPGLLEEESTGIDKL